MHLQLIVVLVLLQAVSPLLREDISMLRKLQAQGGKPANEPAWGPEGDLEIPAEKITYKDPAENMLVAQNATASMVDKDHCLCTVILPDEPFPLERMENLEKMAKQLNDSVLDEKQKIEDFGKNLEWCMDKMKNMTKEIEMIKMPNRPPVAELNVDVSFENLKKEMMEIEDFVEGLMTSLNGSNSSVDNLYKEVQNISDLIDKLESLDKNNLLQVRRDMKNLKNRLKDCQEKANATLKEPMVPYGSCDHNGLMHVGKPNLVQLNWKGAGHKYGGWGKDSAFPPARKNMYWVAPLNIDGRILEAFRYHSSYNDLLLYKNPTDKQLSLYLKSNGRWNHTNGGQGGGMIVHDNYFYYNCYNSRDMCRFNLKTGVVERKTLPNAVFNNHFSYSGTTFQDIDFASDEHGLWVLYSTEESSGNLVISKLDAKTFNVVKSWTTTEYKPVMTNAFMICGVMYAVRPVSSHVEEIFYMYDTNTGKEHSISIMLETMMETVQSLSYNCNDHKIYMLNDGYEVTYDAGFNSK